MADEQFHFANNNWNVTKNNNNKKKKKKKEKKEQAYLSLLRWRTKNVKDSKERLFFVT